MNILKRLFTKAEPYPNIYHPDFKDKVEFAFRSRGVTYYRMTKGTQIPFGRYRRMQEYFLEYDLRMKITTFMAYLNDLEKHLFGATGTVNLNKAYEIIASMKARANLAFAPTQAYNLATVVYFDDTENLYGYDENHNKKKAKAWQEDKKVDFFYMRPLDELLGLTGYSEADLINYIQTSSEIINDLTSDTP